ncbi:uncharacterized protein CTRU02_212051 [Colletotrichum truncatum]|uniref:Uncharacterized protein n=1 Tax=Colletotrichum truncatum TaxID=5467 RepID=A0ACC3YMG9_COLTU|nr:uncharacterized protein CTRU02_06879 [Colletotrichum truncatum]KAF6792262.1 hypothetical protein CTRU02_06879 [Colletotrichum truncatum]
MSQERKFEFSKPVSAPWDNAHVIPAAGWERMKKGFQPQQMEDRWVIVHVVEHDDRDNNSGNGQDAIIFARSWTQFPIAKIMVVPAADSGDDGSRKIAKITWESDRSRWNVKDGEKEAKEHVVRFSESFFEVSLVEGIETS